MNRPTLTARIPSCGESDEAIVFCQRLEYASEEGGALMNRSTLTALLARDNKHLKPEDCKRVVDTVLAALEEQLASGGRVELRGFGTFSLRHYPARMGRNPATGDSVMVSARYAVHFKPASRVLQQLNAES